VARDIDRPGSANASSREGTTQLSGLIKVGGEADFCCKMIYSKRPKPERRIQGLEW